LEFEEDLSACLVVLRSGGIIVYPTDTIWGIGCDATNPEAVSKIIDLKRRPPAKSMIVLLADARDINRYTGYTDPRITNYLENTTRPTTVIYEGALGFAPNLVPEDGSIAIRVVREDFCRHLIKRFRKPIVSTSANISGEAAPQNFKGISPDILNGADYVVKYRQNEDITGVSSVLVRFNKSGLPEVIRS
jgi:L-threonylcarbamoyladenylate synthase